MSTLRHARRGRKRMDRRSKLRRRRIIAGVAAAVVGGGVLATGITIHAVGKSLEGREFVSIREGQNTRIYDKNGKILGYIAGTTNRTAVRSRRIPKFLKDATVAIEDKRFYEHDGVDYYRLAGAAVKDIKSGSAREGGSTITMQLMKTLYKPGAGRTLSKKVEESWLAYQFENRNTKDEILAAYLNSVFYGNNAGGVQAASLTYFDKNVWDISLPQAALLAGLPQAPSDYDPFCDPAKSSRCDPGAALARRNLVLDQMAEQGYITPERAAKAKKTDLQLKPGNAYKKKAEGYFFEYVRQKLIADPDVGKKAVQRGGLKIYTTIDRELQSDARTAIQQNLGLPDDPATAVVMLDSRTGYIRAMASSQRFSESSQFNLAQGLRQPGSTFKTFVLTEAIKQGANPNSTFYESKKLDFVDPVFGPIDVSTYSNSYSGVIPITRATLSSDNSVFSQMTLGLGPQNVIDTAYQMGIPKSRNLPVVASVGLGSGVVTPLDMAAAYSPLSNGGYRVAPNGVFRIERPNGGVTRVPPQKTRIFTDGIAYEVTKVLRANVTSGTGTAANIDPAVAGKTGTTENYVDAWFVGYTPCYTTAVWVGYPNDSTRSMYNVHGITVAGATFPAQIWADFMRKVLAKHPCNLTSFPQPENPVSWGSYSDEFTRAASEVTPTTPTAPTATGSTTDSTTDSTTGVAPPPPPVDPIPPSTPPPVTPPATPAPAPTPLPVEPAPPPAPEPTPAPVEPTPPPATTTP